MVDLDGGDPLAESLELVVRIAPTGSNASHCWHYRIGFGLVDAATPVDCPKA